MTFLFKQWHFLSSSLLIYRPAYMTSTLFQFRKVGEREREVTFLESTSTRAPNMVHAWPREAHIFFQDLHHCTQCMFVLSVGTVHTVHVPSFTQCMFVLSVGTVHTVHVHHFIHHPLPALKAARVCRSTERDVPLLLRLLPLVAVVPTAVVIRVS